MRSLKVIVSFCRHFQWIFLYDFFELGVIFATLFDIWPTHKPNTTEHWEMQKTAPHRIIEGSRWVILKFPDYSWLFLYLFISFIYFFVFEVIFCVHHFTIWFIKLFYRLNWLLTVQKYIRLFFFWFRKDVFSILLL